MSLHRVIPLVLLVPGAAFAQTVVNRSTSVSYSSVQSAIDAATAGDTLEVDGSFEETVTVDRDIVLLGATGGAEIASDQAAVITVEQNADLTLDGVDLTALGTTRLLVATAGGSWITVDNAVLQGSPSWVASTGGIIVVQDALSVTLTGVTLVGTAGAALAGSGGGIWAYGGGSLTLTDVTFDHVQATGTGGALYASNIAVECVRCTFDHTGGGQGGAIHTGNGAPLTVRQSLFCATTGSLGGAIFGSDDAEVTSTLFVEPYASTGAAAIWANGGNWVIRNNHFLGGEVTSAAYPSVVYGATRADNIKVRNNLFLDNLDQAVTVGGVPSYAVEYNWFDGNASNTDLTTLSATNDVSGTDPRLVRWSTDGDCTNDALWPTPFASPLVDAGDPNLFDPDGSRSDIGAYGGAYSDAAYHKDADADGAVFLWDCDDTDASITGEASFYADCDNDGQGGVNALAWVQCFEPIKRPALCSATGGWASTRDVGAFANADCDDGDAEVFSGAPETCDAIDRDCDGDLYDGAIDAHPWYLDLDLDGFGGLQFEDCATGIPGWVDVGGDCDDDASDVYPGATDPCGDGLDQDCGGFDGTEDQLVSWYLDADGDGYGDPGTPPLLQCRAGPYPGYVANDADCDDGSSAVRPGAPERCNGIDDDCDGLVDDALLAVTWYADADGDGFGHDGTTLLAACAPDEVWVPIGGDCNDADPALSTECPSCGCASATPGQAGLLALLLAGVLARRRRRVRHSHATGAAIRFLISRR